MSKRRPEAEECFYCGALVSGRGQGDHFPMPKNCGGTATVPCCVSCHDMKDRYSADAWPAAWTAKVMEDWPKMSRETRVFLAKAIRCLNESIDAFNAVNRLTEERDEAQREVCVRTVDAGGNPAHAPLEEAIAEAKRRGWKCYRTAEDA